MRHGSLLLLSAVASGWIAATAQAQVNLAIRSEYPTVILYENLNAFVTIKNQTGGPMVLNPDGLSNIDLRLIISRNADREGDIPRSGKAPITSGVMLRDGETQELMIDVAHSYSIGGEGRYSIMAEVEWKGRIFRSEPVLVDVVKGMEISSTDAALNGYEDMVRRYSLKYWTRGDYEHLFLGVEQPDTHENLGVFDLGSVVRVFKPTLIVEGSGDVLVLHQSGPGRYTRTAFRSTPSEVVFVDQLYLKEDGTPFDEKRAPLPVLQPSKQENKESWWSRLWKRESTPVRSPSSSKPAHSQTSSGATHNQGK